MNRYEVTPKGNSYRSDTIEADELRIDPKLRAFTLYKDCGLIALYSLDDYSVEMVGKVIEEIPQTPEESLVISGKIINSKDKEIRELKGKLDGLVEGTKWNIVRWRKEQRSKKGLSAIFNKY